MAAIGEPERIHFRSTDVQNKLFRALAIVGAALKKSTRPYVAFSGGIDSTAVMVLCEMVRPGIHLAWSDDELELPETLTYMALMQEIAGAQFGVYPGGSIHAGWFAPWADEPFWRERFPGTAFTTSPYDQFLFDEGYDLVFLGTRMEESTRRHDWLRQSGPTYGGRTITRRCCPIWDWTKDDVWALIAAHAIPYNAAYDLMTEIGIPRKRQRVGPMPLAPRAQLLDGWPDVLMRLETRYGRRWH